MIRSRTGIHVSKWSEYLRATVFKVSFKDMTHSKGGGNRYIESDQPKCKCVVGEDTESGGAAVAGLYPGIARINHCCAPNVVWSWTRGQVRRKQVRAVIK